jgi:hypothetical protein
VAVRSKAWVFGRALTGIVVSNPTGGMDVCVVLCCVLSGRGLCVEPIPRPEESYRLWCVSKCVTMKPWRNEEAQAHIGLSSHTKKKWQHCASAVQKYIPHGNFPPAASLNNNSYHFMEPLRFLLCSQDLVTGPCHEPVESSPCYPNLRL